MSCIYYMKQRNNLRCLGNNTIVGGAIGGLVFGAPGLIAGAVLGNVADNKCNCTNCRKQKR